MAEFLESKRIRPNKPRPTQAQLTRLSNREFNALTEKYPKRQSRGREVGCLGRMPEKEYKEHFNRTYGTILARIIERDRRKNV